MNIELLRTFYPRLKAAVDKLSIAQINSPSKIGGWTPGQYLHHLADAQTQAFYRCLWILSEDNTTLKPFDQDNWVALVGHFPIEGSLAILDGVYQRWVMLLDSLQDWQWELKGTHPELGEISIRDIVKYYQDHGEGHIVQFTRFASGT